MTSSSRGSLNLTVHVPNTTLLVFFSSSAMFVQVSRLGLRTAARAGRVIPLGVPTARSARLYATTTRPPPSPSDNPPRGQEPPLPSPASPQDATTAPMYPNAPPIRGQEPPLPTDEDRPAAATATVAPIQVTPSPKPVVPAAHDPTLGPDPLTARTGDVGYPKVPPEPPRGQEPPLPTDAVQPAFTVPPSRPVQSQQPTPPPPRAEEPEPPQSPPPPQPRKPRKRRTALSMFNSRREGDGADDRNAPDGYARCHPRSRIYHLV